ncbi:phiSA1p31-related protein [Streptomyces sp. NBC_01180]|uniref:phiSA1p31-related protein n=1 Tax=Streptomyces sp. NBC_01180 TaxID=2903763 RepID=UPI00386EA80A|nr:phiSA1p31-related protein [Streptomyces sp. NBC_01180]
MTTQTFKLGDKVKHTDGWAGVVRYGPFKTRSGYASYLVEETGRSHRTAWASKLAMLPRFAVGDTVEAAAIHRGTLVAGPFTCASTGGNFWVVETSAREHVTCMEHALVPISAPDPYTYTYKGATYVKGARYTDRDGDTWEVGAIDRDGNVSADCSTGRLFKTLAHAVDNYGPLTRV